MKIIAKVDGDRFIVEATKDELARVAGYSSEYAAREAKTLRFTGFAPGDFVAVNDSWNLLTAFRAAPKELSRIEAALLATAATFAPITPLFKGIEEGTGGKP